MIGRLQSQGQAAIPENTLNHAKDPVISLPPARPIPWYAALSWCINGLRLWWRSPFILFLLPLITLVVEALVQVIPVAGVMLSKMIVPILNVGIVIGLNQLAGGGRLHFSSLIQGFRRERLPILPMIVAISLLEFGTQLAVATFVYGPSAADFVLLGHRHSEFLTSTFTLTLILPSVVPGILLGLVTPLMLFHGVSPWRAVRLSVLRVVAAWRACLLFLLITTIVFAIPLSNVWLMLLLLLVLPWSFAAGYAFYRDVITGETVPVPVHTTPLSAVN